MTVPAVAHARLTEFAAAAREMARPGDVERTLAVVLERAQQALICSGVGLLLVDAGQITTAGVTGAGVQRADDLQMECREGPCLEAITDRRDHIVDDLRSDERWPVWGPRAAELGWLSILSVGLADASRSIGALNFYSREPAYFSADDLVVGEVFAAHASVALANAQERQQLLQAVDARHLIGQAQGILMERYSIDAEQAFTVLRRYSSHMNRKLRVVAADIVREGRLPEL